MFRRLESEARKQYPELNHYPFYAGMLEGVYRNLATEFEFCKAAVKAPAAKRGQVSHTHWFGGEPIECHLEYEKGEAPILSPIEDAHPGYPGSMTLISAWLRGVDVYEILGAELVADIEEEALTSYEVEK